MKKLSVFERQSGLNKLKTEEFDIVIVGGGINGAGVARDAASRGLKVAVVEARDFSFGTSSRSSKLIHGGIRYLENLEFGLVFEALSERKTLFEIAPHLVHPLRFVLPVYKNSRVGMFKMSLGMWLYDMLSLFDAPESHERLDEAETMERLPMLETKNLEGAFAYYDAYMDDDRLTLETLRSAVAMGATAVNYTSVIGQTSDSSGKILSLKCRDEISGQTFEIKGRHFIGSVGPWTDIFGQDILGKWKKTLRPTKGVHITLDRNRLPLKEAIVMVDDAKNRIVFGIPRHEMIIIGTTDTDYPGDPATVHTERNDINYLKSVIEEYFPGARLTEADILSSYSGVRPLMHDGSESEGKTSREHKIWTHGENLTFVAGGKYTTYRLMSEQVVDHALQSFAMEERVKFSHSSTKKPLNELASPSQFLRAKNLIPELATHYGYTNEEVAFLVERHGMEAEELLSRGMRESLNTVWEIEAYHAIHNTMCMNLDDFYIRRVPLFLSRADHGLPFIESVVSVFARYLGWDEQEKTEQKGRLHKHLKFEMGWRLS